MRAYAKINLGLDVLRRREDGYHDLRMIMQTVQLYDRIYIRSTKAEGIRIKTNLAYLPSNENNLAYRAAKLLMSEFPINGGVFIQLDKRIPVAAGLAGGSADAAAVLEGMNRLCDLNLSTKQLMELGVRLGADVPYCILKGMALAEGIGEQLTPLPGLESYVVLAKPPVHVSTKFVYQNLHLEQVTEHPDIDAQIEAIRAGDLEKTAALMGNVLESVTVPAYPVIEKLIGAMKNGGALGGRMSGSGPTVFGLFDDRQKAEAVFRKLKTGKDARAVYLVKMLNRRDRV